MLKRFSCGVLLGLLAMSFAAGPASAQDDKLGSSSFKFLDLGMGARATGMGDVQVALANDATALFWNPGALTEIEGTDVHFTYSKWLIDTDYSAIGFAHSVENYGTFGVSVIVLDFGTFEATDVSDDAGNTLAPTDNLTGETFTASSLAVGFSYAKNLSDSFSLGGTVKFLREDLAEDAGGKTGNGVAFDVGTLFYTGYRNVRIGAAITNFGPDVDFLSQEDNPLPQVFRLGVAMDTQSWAESDHNLTYSVEIVKTNDLEPTFLLGGEYSYGGMVFIRGGINTDTDVAKGHFGLGFGLEGFKVDYALSNFEFFDTVHRISVGYGF